MDIGGADEFGHGPKLQPDGKIVLSGSSWVGGDLGFDCAIVRLLPDGRLDPEFGSGGHVLLDVGNATNRCHAFVLPGGRLLAVGHTKGSIGIQPTVARLMPDGSLDSTFGTEGTLLLDLGQPATLRAALALSDGRMLLGGERSNGSDRDFLLVALDAAGRPDQAFANDGEMIVDVQPGTDDYVQQLLLDHRGRLLIQGRTKAGDKSTLVVMRLLL